MNGLGSGDLLVLAELELAERRRRASRDRLVRDLSSRQAGLALSLVQAVGRGLIRAGERLQGSSLAGDLTAENGPRLDRVPAS